VFVNCMYRAVCVNCYLEQQMHNVSNTDCTVKHSDMFRCTDIIFTEGFVMNAKVTKSVKLIG